MTCSYYMYSSKTSGDLNNASSNVCLSRDVAIGLTMQIRHLYLSPGVARVVAARVRTCCCRRAISFLSLKQRTTNANTYVQL